MDVVTYTVSASGSLDPAPEVTYGQMIFANVDSFSFGASADVASVSFGHQSDVVGMVLGPDGSYRSQYTGARALPAEHVGRYSLIVTTSAGGSRALYDSPLKLWLGLRNSDDAGTSFDLRTEVFRYPYEPAPVLRSIVHPNGTTLCGAAGSDEFTCQAAASGSHTILVRDSYGAGTGSYSVSLQRLNGPVGCTPLSFGTLPPVGSVEARCFTLPAASAGEELRVRLLSMSSTLDPTAEGLPPLGQMIATPVRLFKAFGGRDDRDLLGPDRMLIVDASATMRPIMIGDTLSRALASVLDRQRHEIGPAPERDGDRVVFSLPRPPQLLPPIRGRRETTPLRRPAPPWPPRWPLDAPGLRPARRVRHNHGAIVNTRERLRWVWPTPASPVIKQIGPPQLAGEVRPAGSLSLQVIRSR